jgi:hypothetical protein
MEMVVVDKATDLQNVAPIIPCYFVISINSYLEIVLDVALCKR